MTDEEFRTSLIRFNEDSRTLFSNAHKLDRERMVCRAFLRCIGVPFTEEEIRKGQNEPVDIAFRSASFQITEILDEDRRRGNELSALDKKLRQANCASDFLEPWKTSVPISFEDAAGLVARRLGEKSTKLGGATGCRGIDALAYVNLRGRHLVPTCISDDCAELTAVRAQGWRSASILMIPYGIVWFASDGSPGFLTETQGRMLADDGRTDRWFEP